MRRPSLALFAVLLVPASAAAINWSDVSLGYHDSPFTKEEAAGISVLTDLGAVEGYADGTFRPSTKINRAEFLKIAMASVPGIHATSCDNAFWNGVLGLCLSDGWTDVAPADVSDKTDVVLAFRSPTISPDRSVVLTVQQDGLLDITNSTMYSDAKVREVEGYAFYKEIDMEDVVVGGQTVRLHVYRAQEPKAEEPQVFYQMSALRGRNGFTVTVATDEDLAELLDAQLRQAVASLTFERQKGCFPDVRADDWFAPYVCGAKDRGVVGGFPDGLFHPERLLNYDQALKILVNLYGWEAPSLPGEPWYAPFVSVASEHGLLLAGVKLDQPLTRGQMARLAAAFRADNDGVLTAYRQAERGIWSSSSSSSSSSSVSSSWSSVSSVSSSSSSSVPNTGFTLPSVTQMAQLGTVTSQPVADATFRFDEDATLKAVYLKFDRKAPSIRSVMLTDALGRTLMTFVPDAFDNDPLTNSDHTWRWTATASGTALVLPAGTAQMALRVALYPYGQGGMPQDVFRVKSLVLSVQGNASHINQQIGPLSTNFPSQQTANAHILEVKNLLTGDAQLVLGQGKLVSLVSVVGHAQSGSSVAVEQFDFTVESRGLYIPRWYLTSEDGTASSDCSVNTEKAGSLLCPVPLGARDVSAGQRYKLMADLSPESATGERALRVSLQDAGSFGTAGAVRWTDGVAHYSWVDLPSPLGIGGWFK